MFETEYDKAPQHVKNILDTYNENIDGYLECKRIINELNLIGWTANYYLDGILFDLKKINKQS